MTRRLTDSLLFIDGGDPKETAEATRRLNTAGYASLDGQTTNPSLVAKNPDIRARVERGEKLTRAELCLEYRRIVEGIAESTFGPLSIEVYADATTTAETMIAQARDMTTWAPSAVVKLPIIEAGLQAAATLCTEMRLNMTLCFSLPQAAAVYAATRGSKHPVFVSPFVGRLDDRGENGIQLVEHILRLYTGGDGHVQLLAASLRNLDHLMACLQLHCSAITLPFKVFTAWADAGFPLPPAGYAYHSPLKSIPYRDDLTLDASWRTYDLAHPLTDAGLRKFADDWNALLF